MKKTLIATALAVGFAGAAAAQTSVTLYGRVDSGFGVETFKEAQKGGTLLRSITLPDGTVMPAGPIAAGPTIKETRRGAFPGHQNGNRWGLRGSEDLGDGLRVIFELESGFFLNTGRMGQSKFDDPLGTTNVGRIFGRKAFFGLASDAWGQVTFGRQYHVGSTYTTEIASPYGDIYGIAGVQHSMSGTGAVGMDNLLIYKTPEFSGFQAAMGYSFNINGDQESKVSGSPDTNETYWGLTLKYSTGPLTVAGQYDVLNKRDNVAGDTSVTYWALAASYDLDVAKLHLGFGQEKDGVIGNTRGDTLSNVLGGRHISNNVTNPGLKYKANVYNLGATIPIDADSSVMVNWQSARLGGGALKNTYVTAGGKGSTSIYSVVYRYNLSKRTNVYATGAYSNNYDFNHIKATQMVVGLSHAF